MNAHWMDFLKYGGTTPSFDVLERTKKFTKLKTNEEAAEFFAEDYIFRGPIVGPITAKDVASTQKIFNVRGAFPDLEVHAFGHYVDPENPYRCFYFERWRGTHTGDLKLGPVTLPATGNQLELPVHVLSVTWNPDGKIAYACLSPPVDRFEGNTKGAGGIFGLMTGAGLAVPASVGDLSLIMQQRFFRLFEVFGKAWSDEEQWPSWWKSKAKGGENNDM